MILKYEKAVRDKLPDIIKVDVRICEFVVLDDASFYVKWIKNYPKKCMIMMKIILLDK